MAEYTTVFVPGKIYWAKVVGNGALHDNYEKDGREWSYEFAPDDTSFLKEHRLLDRLKEPNDEKNPDKTDYLYLKKPEFNKDGDKNEPIKIYDADNSDWDDRLLGNGTKVVAKLTIADWGKGKKKSIWTSALRIEELVPYEGKGGGPGFADYDNQNGKTAKKKAPKKAIEQSALDELDDDMPF